MKKQQENHEVESQEISSAEYFGVAEPETQVTVIGDNGGIAIFDPNQQRFYSSIPNNTIEQKATILRSLGNSDYSLKQVSEKKIMYITDIIAHGVQLTREDGTKENADRIILVMEDGTTVSGCSKGFKGSITNMTNIFGMPPYSPALPIKVMDVPLKQGSTFNIRIADDKDELPRIGRKKK